jgi:hypothetical protein
MRYAALTVTALCLGATGAFGQQPPGQQQATRQRERRPEPDSTFIARERAAWNAIRDADSAAFVHAIGSSPSLFFVTPGGVLRTSTAQFAGTVTRCDTRSNKLDMFNLVHPNDDTAVLMYRVTLDRRCGTEIDRGVQQMIMTVWVRRNGRWEAVAQSITPVTARDNVK